MTFQKLPPPKNAFDATPGMLIPKLFKRGLKRLILVFTGIIFNGWLACYAFVTSLYSIAYSGCFNSFCGGFFYYLLPMHALYEKLF